MKTRAIAEGDPQKTTFPPIAVGEVTQLLGQMHAGQDRAWSDIYSLLYQDLRRHAGRTIWRNPGPTYSPTALVHETWLRMGHGTVHARSRGELIGLIVHVMRCTLVDELRRKLADKRGGGVEHLELSDSHAAVQGNAEMLVHLSGALDELECLHPRLAKVVEWRYFGGLGEREIAELLGLTERTVRRDWQAARLFLLDRLGTGEGPAENDSTS